MQNINNTEQLNTERGLVEDEEIENAFNEVPEKKEPGGELKPNMLFLWMYATALGIGVLQIPMVFTCNSLTPPIFAAKFGWTEDQIKLNNALITTAGVVGMTLGSFLGGKTITLGRRKAALLT